MGGDGTDMFGTGTADKSWGESDPTVRAIAKVDAAFEIMDKLSIDYYCFHDRDLSPEYGSLAETNAELDKVVTYLEKKQARSSFVVLLSASTIRDICTAQELLRRLMFLLSQRLRLRRLLRLQ